jgi:CRISPR-associated protein Csx10
MSTKQKRQYFKITTIQPVVMTASNATQGGLQSLDYLTGSSLLGLAASKLYSKLSEEQSWHYFHNGSLCFSDAYPVVGNLPTIPTPASWYFEKGKQWSQGGRISFSELTNHCSPLFSRNDSVQYKQCRDGFVNGEGQVSSVKHTLITKTALDENQTAKDGQLFNYSAIDAEQTFVSSVYGEEHAVELVTSAISGIHSVGRSRSSEFGKVMIEAIESPYVDAHPSVNNDTVVLFCQSDLEVIDQFGQPTFTPLLSDLVEGVDEDIELSPNLSFIRTHRVNLFNRARGGFDSENLLITKGSILVFEGVTLTDELLHKLASAVGLNQQLGFGQVIVNPTWLIEDTYSGLLFNSRKVKMPEVKGNQPIAASTPLTRFVSSTLLKKQTAETDTQIVKGMIREVAGLYQVARGYNQIVNAHDIGPTSSQLRRVSEVYRANKTAPLAELFEGEHAVCKPKNDELGWGVTWDNGVKFTTFASEMKTILDGRTVSQIERFIELLCRYEPCQYKSFKKLQKEVLNAEGEY